MCACNEDELKNAPHLSVTWLAALKVFFFSCKNLLHIKITSFKVLMKNKCNSPAGYLLPTHSTQSLSMSHVREGSSKLKIRNQCVSMRTLESVRCPKKELMCLGQSPLALHFTGRLTDVPGIRSRSA